jgi:hypothetical protein
VIARSNDNVIDELEVAMLSNFDAVDCPVKHMFTNGMYIRELFMPAGSMITSKIHNTEHPYTVSYGVVAVSIDGGEWDKITAPYTGITKPGTRRVLYVIEDCIWTTYHPLDDMKSEFNDLSVVEQEEIVDKIEERILEPHTNLLTGTNINIEYKDILNNEKHFLWHG